MSSDFYDWLDEVPYGQNFDPDIKILSPDEIDAMDNQERFWLTLRVAMTQAYAEGFAEGRKFKEIDFD